MLPKLGGGQPQQGNNCRFMSELGVNSCTGYSPPLIKQAHFAGLCLLHLLLQFPLLLFQGSFKSSTCSEIILYSSNVCISHSCMSLMEFRAEMSLHFPVSLSGFFLNSSSSLFATISQNETWQQTSNYFSVLDQAERTGK